MAEVTTARRAVVLSLSMTVVEEVRPVWYMCLKTENCCLKLQIKHPLAHTVIQKAVLSVDCDVWVKNLKDVF